MDQPLNEAASEQGVLIPGVGWERGQRGCEAIMVVIRTHKVSLE